MSAAIKILNKERIPAEGCLVIPGRISASELAQLEQLFAGRPITWLIEDSVSLSPQVQSFLQRAHAGATFSDADDDLIGAGEQLRESLANKGVLIFVPGKVAVPNACPCHIPGKTLRSLGAFALPILPIAIDYPQETALAVERLGSQARAVFSIGHLIPGPQASAPSIRQALLEASEEAFTNRSLLKGSLATCLLEGLKMHGSRVNVHDGSDDSKLGYDRLLAAALVFSKYIREETDNPRIGIILPPGKAGMIANLAVVFAGKTPVNLNFTASHEAIRSAISQADLDRFITADPFVRKVASFPWPPNRDLIYIERVLPTLKSKIITWAILSKILPSIVLRTLFGIGKRKNNDEAVLLFTSGSSGEPKGVVLTHRNMLANVSQFASRLNVPTGSKILGSLPLFHSFGCTATLWFPVLEGLELVTYPNPLETKRLAQLISQNRVNILLSTPTFLRAYMKRVTPEQLESLKLIVTGAEKLPTNLAEAFNQRFGITPQEGYGLTETSPATNVNLPDSTPAEGETLIASSRIGSVGLPLPGLGIRLTNPATDQPCPINQQGIIWFKGSNIFPGYLNNPKKTEEVLGHDGWFRTGDVGRVDDDGFLFIEGRISRFSKIAGEMVPHEAVEAAVNKALGLDSESERKIAIVGIPDAQKGEAIVLLSTLISPAPEQECIGLRYKLMDAGIPSLWCPKILLPVTEIPVLASGKLDLKACETLALAPG